MIRKISLLFLAFLPFTLAALEVTSPNHKIALRFELQKGIPTYWILFHNKVVIQPGTLGFELKNGMPLRDDFTLFATKRATVDETWNPVWGEQKEIRNHYNELSVELSQGKPQGHIIFRFRVFDDGVGFRTEFPNQPNLTTFTIAEELTQIKLGKDYKAFWIPGDYDTNEYAYTTSQLSQIPALMQKATIEIMAQVPMDIPSVQTPLMLKSADNIYINIHEAALSNYPAMMLELDTADFTLTSHLVPGVKGDKGRMQTPAHTPWRTILISDKAVDILASNTILNLNEPSKITDTSWIKPLKYIGVWWEMFLPKGGTWNYTDSLNLKIAATDYSKLTPNGRHAANNANVRKYIDFAAEHGFQGVLVEGWNVGWEDWIGDARDHVFDFVTPYPDFDVVALNRYAASKGVKLIMHHETAASVPNYERRLDSAYLYMKKHGYDAVKSGYVGEIIPWGEYHYGQTMVNHFEHAIKKAAENQIVVNAHESVHPTGMHRTYPNYIAAESGRGTEFEAMGGLNPDHTTILPFTRMMGGPMDFTPGIFQTDLSYYDPQSTGRVNTTLVKQLAYYVVLYSPLQMAADKPENYLRFPDAFTFIKEVPVDWDKTVIIEAEPGDYVSIARKEKGGENWYVGGITDENKRIATIPLNFLTPNRKYLATLYTDASDADYLTNPQAYTIKKEFVNSKTILKIPMARSGGFAISIKPTGIK